MSDDPQQDRYSDQRELFYPAKTESMQIREWALHTIGQQARNRDLDERVEDPKHQNRERKAEFENAFRSVPEATVRRESEEVFEIRRKSSDDNG